MTFKEYLTELFDKPAPIKIEPYSSDTTIEATFETENGKYIVAADRSTNRNEWVLAFAMKKYGGDNTFQNTSIIKDRFVVMSTVLNFFENLYKRYPTNIYKFSCESKDTSKVKLYDSIVKKASYKHNLNVEKIKTPSSSAILWKISNK